MSSRVHENKKGYDQCSAFYDRYPNPTVAIDDQTFPNYYKHLSNKNILEVGCGTGRHTLRLLSGDNRVTAVDISEGMLKELRQKIQSENLQVICGDFLQDEIPSAPFDALVTSLVLEHMEDLNTFFARACAFLKNGAEIFISDIHPQRTEAGVFAHFKDEQGNEVALQSSAHREDEVRKAAEENGFRVKVCDTICGTPELADLKEKWSRYLNHPMIQIWVMEKI